MTGRLGNAYTRKSTGTRTFTQPAAAAGVVVPLNQTVSDKKLAVVNLKCTDIFHSLSTIAEKVILFCCRCYSPIVRNTLYDIRKKQKTQRASIKRFETFSIFHFDENVFITFHILFC